MTIHLVVEVGKSKHSYIASESAKWHTLIEGNLAILKQIALCLRLDPVIPLQGVYSDGTKIYNIIQIAKY